MALRNKKLFKRVRRGIIKGKRAIKNHLGKHKSNHNKGHPPHVPGPGNQNHGRRPLGKSTADGGARHAAYVKRKGKK